MTFTERLQEITRRKASLLCIGLDIEVEKVPRFLRERPDPLLAFNRAIVEATQAWACAYKMNTAFYEAHGAEGWRALKETVRAIPDDILKIADAKRGDIGSSSRLYARAFFEELGFDAITVNPYLGRDGVAPFIEREEYGAFFLCLTSNPGASDFQYFSDPTQPLFERVAERVSQWNERGNCGLVIGATHPEELKRLREIVPELPFLIPGIGTQGGDLEWAVRYGTNARGEFALLSASRSVIYASSGEDFAQAAGREAQRLRDEIQRLRFAKDESPLRERQPAEATLEMFRKTGAILEGHFQLTSGLHSPTYFQCAKVLQYPHYAEKLCRKIADHFASREVDAVVAPALGGIIVGQEVARRLGARSLFAERENGKMTLRRGFELKPGERVLVVEDVMTTGGSVQEVIDLAKSAGATVVGVACLVDRSGGKLNFGVEKFSLLALEVMIYDPKRCPWCAKGVPLIKPGSRPEAA